ncbi:MAG TPA: CARDB domain-containing protein, partial [Polyangiales bacterium]|nr:CARDB domain-containing protein [Polyangiales bacterium]
AIVQKPIDAPKSHWIYGSQYDDLPVCYATQKFGGPWLSREFMCLCLDDCRKANLVVTAIRPRWDGTQSVIEADITNSGASAAGASTAKLVDYQSGAGSTAATPSIAAGATVTVTFTLPYWVYDPDATLDVSADSENKIDECNENDNRLRFFELG